MSKVVRVVRKFGRWGHVQFDKTSMDLGYSAQSVDSMDRPKRSWMGRMNEDLCSIAKHGNGALIDYGNNASPVVTMPCRAGRITA